MAGLSRLFDNPTYSDITIRFGNQEVSAHKAILCERLPYFEKLCGASSKFKEAGQRTVELFDDDPSAVRALLLFLYDIDFSEGRPKQDGHHDLEFKTMVYMVASKYGCENLQREVEHELFRVVCNLGAPEEDTEVEVTEVAVTDLLSAMSLDFDLSPHNRDYLRNYLHQICGTMCYQDEGDRGGPRQMFPAVRKPILNFVITRPKLAQHFVEYLAEEDNLEAIKLFRCPNCGKVSSDEEGSCDGKFPVCEQGPEPATYFRIKSTKAIEGQ